MKRPSYEEVNGDVPKYLILMNKYCDELEGALLSERKRLLGLMQEHFGHHHVQDFINRYNITVDEQG